MGLKLSLFGAPYLGNGLNSRKSVREKLRLAYQEASRAVHRGSVTYTSETRALRVDVQNFVVMAFKSCSGRDLRTPGEISSSAPSTQGMTLGSEGQVPNGCVSTVQVGMHPNGHMCSALRSVGQLPGHHVPAVLVYDGYQVEESPGHGQVGDVGGPHLVGLGDFGLFQQIEVNPMLRSRPGCSTR